MKMKQRTFVKISIVHHLSLISISGNEDVTIYTVYVRIQKQKW